MNDQLKAAEAELASIASAVHAIPLGPLAPVVEGGFSAMKKTEWIVCGPRERIGAVLRGANVARLADGNAGARPYKIAPTSDAPGSRALHAVGLAAGTRKPVLCFLGSASFASGAFHEALNAAAITQAPVIFLVALTPITDDAPVGQQLTATPAALAQAFGINAAKTAPTAAEVKAAVAHARTTEQPALIQATLEL